MQNAPNPALVWRRLDDRALAQPERLGRRRGQRPQIKKPGRRQVVGQLQDLRIVASELLAHPIGQANAVVLLGHAQPFVAAK
jgi:hypothetical protein